MTHLFTGVVGGPHFRYSKVPGSPECDKELLKLLPEFKRISLKEIDYISSQSDKCVQMAAKRGIDMYKDDEETLPEEIQRYWACVRAWAQYSDLIASIEEECKAQQGPSCAEGWRSASRFFKRGKKK